MRESDEREIHRKVQNIQGEYEVRTDWGKIMLTLDAIPNYAGGKGCPDEILVVKIRFPLCGIEAELSAPVLIEGEKAGCGNARLDLEKFAERSLSGEQKSYLKIPVIVVGGTGRKNLKPIEKAVRSQFNITQVPKNIII